MNAEPLTVLIIALATIGLYFLNKYKTQIFSKASLIGEDLEELIEEKTGLDVEISDVIEEVIEDVVKTTEGVLEDAKDDGSLEESISDVAEDLVTQSKEKIQEMTVNQIKKILKEKGLPTNGKKSDLIERLLKAGV